MSSITNTIIFGIVAAPISYGIGYGYGKLFNADKKIAALAFLVISVSKTAYNVFKQFVFGDQKENPKAYYLKDMTCSIALSSIQVAALNRLNLISNKTTHILLGMDIFALAIAGLSYCYLPDESFT